MIPIKCIEINDEWLEQYKQEISKMDKKPSLLIVSANDDSTTQRYVNDKVNVLRYCGIRTIIAKFGSIVTTQDLINYIGFSQGLYSAVIVQSPLYSHLDEDVIVSVINPLKRCNDNLGKLLGWKPIVTQMETDLINEIVENIIECHKIQGK